MQLGFSTAEETLPRRGGGLARARADRSAFKDLRGVRSLTEQFERRRDWERALGRARWSCVGWPAQYGGRDATLAEQVIFAEEYARAAAPARLGHLGIELVGPTLLAFGTEAQKQRFLPADRARRGDLVPGLLGAERGLGPRQRAHPRTARARCDGDEWVIDGQKVWTSLAQFADWIFVALPQRGGQPRQRGLCRSCSCRCDSRAIDLAPDPRR